MIYDKEPSISSGQEALSEQEILEERVSRLSTSYVEFLKSGIDANLVYRDKNTDYYRLTPDGRQNAHSVFSIFIEQADGNHQLLRLALNSAYETAKSEFQQGRDEERLDESGWALLRTMQSIQGVNTWQEANKLYEKAIGQTAKESTMSAAKLYQEAKKIREQLESEGTSVDKYLKRDEEKFDKLLQSETETLDEKTSTLLSRTKKNISALREKIGGWLPREQKNRQPQIETRDISPEKVSSLLERKISRRQFLKFAGATGAAAVLGPVVEVGLDLELQAGVRAASARPEMPGGGEKREVVSQSVLLEVYKKHFQGKEHLLSEKVWVRTEDSFQGEVLRGTGLHLAIFAQNCYNAEKRDGEDFDAYYIRFVDSLHELSDLAGMDFITLITSLQISAENIAGFEEPKETTGLDIAVSRFQKVGITAARALRLESAIIESLGPGGVASWVRNEVLKMGASTPLENVLPREGIRHYDLIRFRAQPTTGLMDVEPGERAEAFRLFQDNELVGILQSEYPQVCESYKKVNEKRDRVTEAREGMREIANDYIEKYTDNLRPFAEGNEEALNAIGISPKMDLWQLINYTDVWYKVSEIPTNPEFAYQRTVEYMREEAAKDPQAFYRRLFSQQIRNPKFINYLMQQAITSDNQEEARLLVSIQDKTSQYEQRAKDLRIAHLDVLQAEGQHEYNSRFQQATSILVTKRLSDAAGDFNPGDKNSLGWHIYKTCVSREIAPIPFLADDKPFACDVTIDPPYAKGATVESLGTFAGMLQEAGILEIPPNQDISSFYGTMEKMFWRDGGVWFGAQPSPEDKVKWEKILEHFNTKIANRLFYDYAGLLRDEQKMNDLNRVMIERGLISKPANEDPYYFFTQFVYLALRSSHMRRDIPKEDWDEAERYFQKNIMPMVITREETSPGVFREKWNIGSADYPPVFRAQAVMHNFLIDQNLEALSSTSSSGAPGHYNIRPKNKRLPKIGS